VTDKTTRPATPGEERGALLAICARAGIPSADIIDDPEHGLMVAAHQVHKLRSLASPSRVSEQIGKMATGAARAAIKRVK